MTVFNRKAVDHTKEHMFFGESCNTARYDKMKYPKIDNFTEQQLSFFWTPQEVSVSTDINDFKNKLSMTEQRIYILNLQYQTLLDSVQGRSPNQVLLPICSLPELETWIETWSFSECLAEGTEVLTQDGWKDLANTTTQDECLVYDLDREDVFFEKPKRVVEYDVDTDMVRYRSKNPKQFDQLVTPNHRMPVIHRDINTEGKRKKYFKEAIFQDYKAHHLAPISGCVRKEGEGISAIERLLVAAQADGTVSERYTGERCGSIPVWFNLTKLRKVDRLLRLCDDAGVEVVHLSDDKRDQSKRLKVNIPLCNISQYRDVKSFNWVDLSNVSLLFCREFIEELSHWDSHIQKDTSFTYSTTDRSNADVVQAIAAMCGKSPRRVVRSDDRKESYKDIYSINILDRSYKDGQSIEKEYVKYKGKVRCLETSTGAFLIRYNGVVSVTGNTIHSRSYTYIIKNVFDNPSEVLDDIMKIPQITDRAGMVTEAYEVLESLIHNDSASGRDKKIALFRCMVSVYALEAIRFYVSFACSYSFVERGLMEGNGKIMSLINRDEHLHQGAVHFILTRWLKGLDDPEMTNIAKEFSGDIGRMLMETYNQECEWIDFLFSEGSIPLLNADVLKTYLKFLCDKRMKSLGMKELFGVDVDPLPWMGSYTNAGGTQVAPQEVEISSYKLGSIDMNSGLIGLSLD